MLEQIKKGYTWISQIYLLISDSNVLIERIFYKYGNNTITYFGIRFFFFSYFINVLLNKLIIKLNNGKKIITIKAIVLPLILIVFYFILGQKDLIYTFFDPGRICFYSAFGAFVKTTKFRDGWEIKCNIRSKKK